MRSKYFLFILLPACFAILGLSLFLPFWGFNRPVYFWPLIAAILFFSTIYPIVKYRVMDVNLIIKKSTAYSITTTAITFSYVLLVLAFELIYSSIRGSYSYLATIPAAFIFAVTFAPFREYLQKFVNNIFFRQAIEYQKIVKEVSLLVSSVTDLNTLFRLIDRTIVRAMCVKNVAVLLLEERENCFRVEKKSGDLPAAMEVRLPLNCALAAYLEDKKDAIVLNEAKSQAVKSEMETFGAAIAIPSFTRGKLVGILCLGEKLSGEPYTLDDIELLNTLAAEAAIAIENAKLYRDITETRDYLNSLVEGSNDAILTMNLNGVLLSWNKGAEIIFGYNAHETVGKTPVIFTENEVQDLTSKVLRGEIIKTAEIYKKNKAGDDLPLLLTLSPILDQNKKTIGISAILKNITELRKVDKLKQDLLSTVSQELHTPIIPIKESLSFVLNDQLDKLPPKQREALTAALSQSNHLDNLIDSLIDISRIEAGKPLELKKAPVYMDEIVKESIENYKPGFQSKNINLTADYPSDRVALMADKNKLLRVMDNLLENARKFTPKGGSIKAAIITEKTEIKISITDTGMGLAPENLEKIFEKFYQIDTAYTHLSGGIGMGLTIAKEIIEAHNGKIRAESNGVGKGSAFIFTLPLTV